MSLHNLIIVYKRKMHKLNISVISTSYPKTDQMSDTTFQPQEIKDQIHFNLVKILNIQ